MSKKHYYILFFILLQSNVYAAEADRNCSFGVESVVGKTNEGLIGCAAAKISLRSDPKAEEEYRKKLDLKLAKYIALQSKQVMQELALSSKHYEQNQQSFLMGKESQTSCRFEFLKTLETNGCGEAGLKKSEKNKVKMLIDSLNEQENITKANSLFDSISNIYSANKYGLGFGVQNSRQCPLISSYALNSQIADFEAENIIATFQSEDSSNKEEAFYDNHSLLSMIKNSDNSLKDDFKKYVKAYDKSKGSSEKYLLNFFFDKKNKEKLGSGVAKRCEQVKKSVTTFVCGSLEEIGSVNSKVSKTLFDEYNPKKEFNEQKKNVKENPDSYRTYAFLCEKKEKLEKSSQDLAIMNLVENENKRDFDCPLQQPQRDNVDEWYGCFTKGLRPENSKDADDEIVGQFCSKWSCIDEKVKESPSCKNGGPLTAADLEALNLKDDYFLKQVEFLKRFQSQKKYNVSQDTNGKDQIDIKDSISEFDLNAFGAETVMKFVGIPSTPVTLALVTQDMHDKGIKPSTPEEIREVITRATNLAPKVASNSSDDDFNMTPTIASTPAVASASNWKNTNYIKPEPSPIAKTKHKIVEAPSKRNPEVQQMMDDLQEIMKAGKGTSTTDEGDEAASTSFSGGASASANSKKQAKTIQGLTSSDLETWAQKLKAKETTLNFRETLADQRDAEFWRNKALSEGGEKEKGRSIASVDEKDSQGKSGGSTQATLSSDSGKAKTKAELAAEVSASSTGLIVTPEKLDKLEKMDLKNFGVNIEEPFVISVRMNGKLIHVRVAKVEMKGREFLAPRLTDDNKEAKEVILNSPLFKEFRYFYEKENSSYFPVKSANN